MLISYLRTAVRALRNQPLYATINIAGLAVGVTAFLLMVAYVRFEFSFDRFHEKADRTVRIIRHDADDLYLGSSEFAITPAPLAGALLDEVPGVEQTVALRDREYVLTAGDRSFLEQGLTATPSFFDVFSFELAYGDERSALAEPGSIVLTGELADRLFGTGDPVGRSVEITLGERQIALNVTGVLEPVPSNSHLAFSWVMSMSTLPWYQDHLDLWGTYAYYTYAVLRPDADPTAFSEQVSDLAHRHLLNEPWYQGDPEHATTLLVQPLKRIHLHSRANFDVDRIGDYRRVIAVGILALLVLLIPCTNYMNLATARADRRGREVGIRKAVGADRRQLVRQFLGESTLLSAAAVAAGFGLAAMLRPTFDGLVGMPIPAWAHSDGWAVGLAVLTALFVGIVSGSHPAFVLARPPAARILRGGTLSPGGRSRLRDGLVVVQFAVAIGLMFATLVINGQMAFIASTDTGMVRDQVIAIEPLAGTEGVDWEVARNELATLSGVVAVSGASDVPTDIRGSKGISDWSGRQEGQELDLYVSEVNYGYPELLDIRVVEGRGFDPAFGADDAGAVVINEAAARAFGWDEPLGKSLDLGSAGTSLGAGGFESRQSMVVGVVADFHFHSFRQEIAPLALVLDPEASTPVLVRVASDDITGTLGRVRGALSGLAPDGLFDIRFLDDSFDSLYAVEARMAGLFDAFTLLALIIACMGLLGLSAHAARQRVKEIGVRKVFGAGVSDIVFLLSRDYTRLVAIAVVIGCPLAWVLVDRWLDGFAYRVEAGVGTVLLSAGIAVTIGWFSVSWQSVRAARTRPVACLRYE